MLAAMVADFDGAGIIVSRDAFVEYHHVVMHNALAAVAVAAILATVSWSWKRWGPIFLLYLGIFHLHLLMDYYGSGYGWKIAYFWPFSDVGYRSPHGWRFHSWQNITAAFGFLAWVLVIAVVARRTPLEKLMPSLDRQLVELLRRWAGLERRS